MNTEFEASPWGRIYVVHNQGALRPDDDDRPTRTFAAGEVVNLAILGEGPWSWHSAIVLADAPAGCDPIRVLLPRELRCHDGEEAEIGRECVLAVTVDRPFRLRGA